MKKIVYVDMDNVLVDFPSAFSKLDPAILSGYEDNIAHKQALRKIASNYPYFVNILLFI